MPNVPRQSRELFHERHRLLAASETRTAANLAVCSLIRACSSLISLRTVDVSPTLNSTSPSSLRFLRTNSSSFVLSRYVRVDDADGSFGRFRGADETLAETFESGVRPLASPQSTHGEVDIIITRYCCTGFFRMMLSVSIRAPTSALLK